MHRPDPRQALFELLESAVTDGVFPGCVALVWCDGAQLYHEGHGTLATHPWFARRTEPVVRDTVYDLASLTKVLCTTTLAAMAVGERRIALDNAVPTWLHHRCHDAKLVDLLEHASGLAAHAEYFTRVHERGASARDDVFAAVAASDPEYRARERTVYSDLGFMILGRWLEDVYEDMLDRAFDHRIAAPLGLDEHVLASLGFRRISECQQPVGWVERRIAPSEVYDASLHPEGEPTWFAVRAHDRIAHGTVHDDNAYVMGGVAGHAGLFGTATGVLEIARAWLEGGLVGLSRDVRDRFWQLSSVPGSTRRCGWHGPEPDGTGSSGTALSSDAAGHTGFTGTSLWIDPRPPSRIFVLLSNRVHPSRSNERIRAFRMRFHQAAALL